MFKEGYKLHHFVDQEFRYVVCVKTPFLVPHVLADPSSLNSYLTVKMSIAKVILYCNME